jgi:hypothetical protein
LKRELSLISASVSFFKGESAIVIAYVASEDARDFNIGTSEGAAAGWVIQLEDEKFRGQRILVKWLSSTRL